MAVATLRAESANIQGSFKSNRRHPQGCFKHLAESDLDQIQQMVDEDWGLLQRKAGMLAA
jgi:hypothetical protein